MVSTVQKTVEHPVEFQQVQILDRVADLPVVVQRQEVHFLDKFVDIPVVSQRLFSIVLTIQRAIDIPQLQHIVKVVDFLVKAPVAADTVWSRRLTVRCPPRTERSLSVR